MLKEGTKEVFTDRNWELVKIAAPGSIKFMEGLHYLQPKNEDLLKSLIISYSGYAFAIHDTLVLGDKLAENDNTKNLDQAVFNFSKALDYTIAFFETRGINFFDLRKEITNPSKILSMIDDNMGDEDVDAVFFGANAWAGLINLQKKNLDLMASLPIVKIMFDWVCTKKPDIMHGACGIFYAAYEAGRPRMLGGNPEKGKKIFLETISKYPQNLMARVAYIQYYLILQSDEDAYNVQKKYLEEAFVRFDAEMRNPSGEKKSEKYPDMNFFNAVAKKRMEFIKKYESDIF